MPTADEAPTPAPPEEHPNLDTRVRPGRQAGRVVCDQPKQLPYAGHSEIEDLGCAPQCFHDQRETQPATRAKGNARVSARISVAKPSGSRSWKIIIALPTKKVHVSTTDLGWSLAFAQELITMADDNPSPRMH
jgi:hypothetical protein